MDLFRKKEINLNHTSEMKKELKTSDLIMLGIGAIIGTGIFVDRGWYQSKCWSSTVTFICLSRNRCHFVWTKFRRICFASASDWWAICLSVCCIW